MKHSIVFLSFKKMGPFPASFSLFSSFLQLTVNLFVIKSCQWLDSNHGPLVLEATALPTETQPLPTLVPHFCEGPEQTFLNFFILRKYGFPLTRFRNVQVKVGDRRPGRLQLHNPAFLVRILVRRFAVSEIWNELGWPGRQSWRQRRRGGRRIRSGGRYKFRQIGLVVIFVYNQKIKKLLLHLSLVFLFNKTKMAQ